MFTARHYEWLARFCVEANLPMAKREALRNALAVEAKGSGANFKPALFDRASGFAEYDAGVAALKRSATP